MDNPEVKNYHNEMPVQLSELEVSSFPPNKPCSCRNLKSQAFLLSELRSYSCFSAEPFMIALC